MRVKVVRRDGEVSAGCGREVQRAAPEAAAGDGPVDEAVVKEVM